MLLKHFYSLTEQAYDSIKDKIIKCHILPGSDISEAQICEELGMSRTPVREALLRLQQENFVTIYPRKGIIVSPITVKDIHEVFQIREMVEVYAGKTSCKNMAIDYLLELKKKFSEIKFIPNTPSAMKYFELDTQFHRYIVRSCKNDYLIEFMNKIYDMDSRIRIMSTLEVEDIEKRSTPEHISIIDALIDRDVKRIEASILEHLRTAREAALKRIY